MFRPLAVNIGLRYARSRRSFISFVSVLALAGLALSVAVLVFVQAVVAGFEREMNDRVLGIVPHITLAPRAPLRDYGETLRVLRGVDGVAAASAVVDGAGLVAAGGKLAGVGLTGVTPREYAAVSRVFEFLTPTPSTADATEEARAADLLPAGGFGILLGRKVAERIGVGVGDDVSVVLAEATVTPLGVYPRQKRFRVAGIVDTGSQLDRFAAYLHRQDAGRLFRLSEGAHSFHVRTDAALEAGEIRYRVARAVGGHRFRIATWFRTFGNLYAAIEVTRGMLFLLLSLLVAVAAFNLVSGLVMIVNERRGDIAMLRTLGGRADLVVGSFVVLGGLVALAGVGLGIGVGVALGSVAEAGFPWLERLFDAALMDEYLITTLPVEFTPRDILRVAATAVGLCLVATVLPAWRAARLNPADVLQHE